jgi:hypothetical protein
VAVFAASGLLGMLFLLHTLNRLTIAQQEPIVERAPVETAPTDSPDVAPRATGAIDPIEGQSIVANVKRIFRVWILLFGIVGAQMAWVLRPFVGTPGKEFTWFRERGSSFFEAVWHAIVMLLGMNGPHR